MSIIIFLNALLSISLSIFLTKKYRILDFPDKVRKRHNKPIPLAGGIALIFFLMICFILYLIIFKNYITYLVIGLILISFIILIGVYNDVFNTKPLTRLILSSLAIFFFISIDSKYIPEGNQILIKNLNFFLLNKNYILNYLSSIFFTILCFLLLQNAFNMIDGINGLALFFAIIWSLLLIKYSNIEFFGQVIFSLLCFLILFLLFNIKNKAFLGDGGNYGISFLISTAIIAVYNNSNNQIFVENIFLWLFIPGVDMLRVFILRLCKKKNPFSPDRSHLHYILLDNIGYKKTILFFILVVSVSLFVSEVYNFLILPVLLFNTLIYSYILMRFNNKRIFIK